MKYQERIDMMKALDPAQLENAKNPHKADAYYKWHVLELLADIAESASSFAYSQSQLLKIQQKRAGGGAPAKREPGAGE